MFTKKDVFKGYFDRVSQSMSESLTIELAMRRSGVEETKIYETLGEYIKIKMIGGKNE